ncbi:MAG: hypothetical protein HGB10_03915 [Coriobacteriia bacterium]|nr:hypothetical protein [Coriobacteriia bacterium]
MEQRHGLDFEFTAQDRREFEAIAAIPAPALHACERAQLRIRAASEWISRAGARLIYDRLPQPGEHASRVVTGVFRCQFDQSRLPSAAVEALLSADDAFLVVESFAALSGVDGGGEVFRKRRASDRAPDGDSAPAQGPAIITLGIAWDLFAKRTGGAPTYVLIDSPGWEQLGR